jgi:hypothetical protein
MIETKKDFVCACLACGIVAFFMANLAVDSQGMMNYGPTLLVLVGLEAAMVVFLMKRLRNEAGKIQMSLLTSLVTVLAIGFVMLMNLARWKPPLEGIRDFGWPWKAASASWDVVSSAGSVIHVPWQINYSNILIDAAMAACIVTACLILCESFVRLKKTGNVLE